MINKVILMGRLTADPELRQTASGIASCRFTVAVDRAYKPKDGEKQTDFISVQTWKGTAEFVSRYFSKGRMIIVEGELQNNNYEKDGVKHYSYVVNAQNVTFGESKAAAEGTAQSTQTAAQVLSRLCSRRYTGVIFRRISENSLKRSSLTLHTASMEA